MAGKSQLPYQYKGNLEDSLMDIDEMEDEHRSDSSDVCKKCVPVLSHYKDTFQGLIQHGPELKKRKTKNPYPKRDDICSEVQRFKQAE